MNRVVVAQSLCGEPLERRHNYRIAECKLILYDRVDDRMQIRTRQTNTLAPVV